jgi:hypothetical protein
MPAERRRGLRFETKPIRHACIRSERGQEELDDHTPLQRDVLGLEHFAHRSAPEARNRSKVRPVEQGGE